MVDRINLPTRNVVAEVSQGDQRFIKWFEDVSVAVTDLLAGGGGGGTLTDGDKGDITVSGAGAVWTIDSGAVSWAEVSGKPATFPPDAHTHVAADVTNLATTVQAYTLDTFANPVASLDFAQQQTLQFVIENRTSDPGSPVAGQLWLRTDL